MEDWQWNGGRGDHVFMKITYSKLSILFGKSKRTVKRWVAENRLDPSNLLDIIEKYNNPHLLDNRRRKK